MSPELLERAHNAYWYHSATLGDHRITGDYDMEALVEHYHIPDLHGKHVLDVGSGSGFFSFLFERMGAARVVATELPHFNNWDVSRTSIVQSDMDRNPDKYDAHLHAAFDISHEVYHSKVQRHFISIYDLTVQEMGTFDIVFLGSVLVHLRDPIRALYAVQPLVKELMILATPITGMIPTEPITYFLADDHHCDRSWWLPNPLCLQRMCEASGFRNTKQVGEFNLTNNRTGDIMPHAVMHCRPSAQ